jgi:hypothetical protein
MRFPSTQWSGSSPLRQLIQGSKTLRPTLVVEV